ncbi:MAG: amino acid permease [Patulibacter sp.]
MSSTPPGVFQRKATGLVREGRTRDALFYNIMWSSVALTFGFFWLFYAVYPGANAIIGFLIAGALGLPGAFLYAMLTQVMPRTGGDYVFNSRALHPSIGFASNFSYVFWLAVVIGVYTTYIAEYGLAALARTIAGYTGATWWLDVASWLTSSWGLFIVGTLLLIGSATLFALGGLRLFFRIQFWVFIVYVLGALLLPMLVGLFSGDGFAGRFDAYAANLGVTDASTKLAASATDAGFASTSFSWSETLKSVSVWWFIFGFIYSSNYFAGEIRMQRRTHLFSMPGAVALVVIILLLLTPSFLNIAGYDVMAQFGLADPASYGFAGAPAYAEIVSIASGSGIIGSIVIIGFAVSMIVWLPQTILLASRSMFAWSFDRVVPEQLSAVEPRTRSPLTAILVMLALSIASTAVYAFTDWFSSLAALLGLSFTLLVTAISGVVLPFRHPRLVAGTSFGRRVLGIPLLSLVGGLAVLGFGTAITILLIDPWSGASLSEDPLMIIVVGVVYVVAVAIYLISRAIRRRQGYDLDLAYRELPAE